MGASWVLVIAHVARLGGSADTRLSAVVLGLVAGTARVGCVDRNVEGGVDEGRVAALRSPGVVVVTSA